MSIVDTFVEVRLKTRDDFLKVKETLTRMGVPSKKENTLYQSCHILHKQDKYYIVHFKELFALDGKPSNFAEEDKARRNVIAARLDDWGLVELVDKEMVKDPVIPMSKVKVIPFKEKGEWSLVAKYNIGKK